MLSRREMLALSAASVCPVCLRLAPAADRPTNVLGGKPTDARLGPPKTLNDYFPFTAAEDEGGVGRPPSEGP